MDRRSALQSVGAAGVAFVTGCLSGSEDPAPSLASVQLSNHTGDPVTAECAETPTRP
ncbi:MAG: hypothetical protein J07HX5_01508 [halophilic archaeon J07HX5]|nr:MAG: hypothetical protein J07HX5_01508 [halophilic archaeon J07HX5]